MHFFILVQKFNFFSFLISIFITVNYQLTTTGGVKKIIKSMVTNGIAENGPAIPAVKILKDKWIFLDQTEEEKAINLESLVCFFSLFISGLF